MCIRDSPEGAPREVGAAIRRNDRGVWRRASDFYPAGRFKSAPFFISIGRRKLSMVTTIRLHTRRKIPHPVSPIQNIQPTAGKRISPGPNWAMHSMSSTAESSAAKGRPAMARPMPPGTV